ncbi:sensor histidine kinase [Actinomycetospora termitidis]|uniref:Sensor histidine kinase n=1 Tax=Actinomycetospora termitidis TaxID=3053470 RepID=A0ABT7M2M3_9PSEU|nr:sensor histidine kinase [Actinomycetospora sp. Odt1-22]MDL5154912.1 sensor histidine kinase [Actinomycetospora sp. Odt1-22]
MPSAAVRRRWPWGVAVAAAALSLAGAPLAVANGATEGLEDIYLGDAVTGALVPTAGALILTHRPRDRVGWLLLSTAGLALGFFLAEWSGFGLHTVPGSLPLAALAGWVSEIVWLPFLALLTLLPLWFPTGRVPSRPWLAVQVVVLALFAALFVACVLHPRLEDGTPSPLTGHLPDWPTDVVRLITTALVFCAPVCLASLLVRYVRADRADRLRLRWFGLAVVLAVGVVLLPGVPTTVGDVLSGVTTSLVAAAVVAAVLGGLHGLDAVVDRSLVYAFTAAATYLLYVVAVTAGGSFLPDAAGFLGVAVVAVTFAPVRTWTQRAVDRLLHGARSDPLAVLRALGTRLDDAPASGVGTDHDGGRAALESVRELLRVPGVAILDPDGAAVAAAGEPVATRPRHEVPLRARGRLLGVLTVALRPGERAPDPRDAGLLEALGRVLAGTLDAHALAADLQQAREHLVRAGEDERRRLHHDLHDGLGPVLSHAVLALDGLRREVGPEAADEAGAATLKSTLQDALVDLRRLVHGLRPPALDDVGLVAALGKHVGLVEGSGLVVVLDAADVPEDLPAAVEVAAYRVVTEALTNVTRHARATACTVALAVGDGSLRIVVSDDGSGPVERTAGGIGLSSLRHRTEELGGGLDVRHRPGGTTLTATLPLHEAV